MNLTPREKDKLLVAMAAVVARRRLERGVKLNHPEAVALISDFVVEGARDGRSVAGRRKALSADWLLATRITARFIRRSMARSLNSAVGSSHKGVEKASTTSERVRPISASM